MMKFNVETLARIYGDGRKAAKLGRSSAACPYLDDINNERLDAWIEGFKAFSSPQVRPLVL